MSAPEGFRRIPVVCALIEREGRLLLAQRPAHKHLGLSWEFPGGKVEAGETAEVALVREIAEELACAIGDLRALSRSVHRYEALEVEMIPFVVRLEAGSPDPTPSEHVALAWVRPEEIESYALAPADWPVVAAYRAWAGSSPG